MLQQAGGGDVGRIPGYALDEAYDYCERVTRHHSKSFYFATSFLPKIKRRAVRALYAFCRWTDDLVDELSRSPASLEEWQAHALGEPLAIDDPILLAWNDTRRRYRLPEDIINELIAGIRMDLTVSRYDTFEALYLYCYRVASTVGLLSMRIIGYDRGAEIYAIKLGAALQLTNILRDVGEDARCNRIYLPRQELARFGLSERDILALRLSERYRELIRFQIARARRLYDEAWPGIGMLHPDGRFAVAVAAEVYRAILNEIEKNEYNNFTLRAYVPAHKRFVMLPTLWWKLKSG